METDIKKLVEQLVVLGEDADELRYWESIYASLPGEGQEQILRNLQKELQELLAIENSATGNPEKTQ